MSSGGYVMIISLSIILSGISFQTDTMAGDVTDRGSLQGLQGVRVLIENANPDAIRGGLKTGQLKDDVESRLSRAGIPLLGRKEMLRMPGTPCLIAKVLAYRQQLDVYLFLVLVELRQDVILERDNRITVSGATTWREGIVGIVRSEELMKIRDSMCEMVDRFISDYRAINAKS